MADSPGRDPVDADPLAGTLVRCRELRDDDLPRLVRWWNSPAVATNQRGNTQPRTADAVAELFRVWSRNERTDCGFAMVSLADDELVGHARLHGATPRNRCAEFAVIVGPEHQGRGFGTDAGRLMLRYGFVEQGLHRVELKVFGFNRRAIACYRRIGFVEEGRRRQAVWRSGAWHDDVLMSVLRAEWATGQGHSTSLPTESVTRE